MLIFDPHDPRHARFAALASELLPMGIPVVAGADLPDPAALGLSGADLDRHLWWVAIDGSRSADHLAVARCLVACRRWWSPLAWLATVPPLSWPAAVAYRMVARTRRRRPNP